MLFDRTVLERYSEFLDQQGLVVGDGMTMESIARKATGQDKRTHEQLVEDFLTSDREDEHEGAMPPGWVMPDQQVVNLEMEMGELKTWLRREQAERVAAQRLLADRAHYVPRQELDRVERLYQELDKAYAESLASHMKRDEVEARLNGEVTRVKELYVRECRELREQLTKAYKILAGAHPPIPDADMARMLFDHSPPQDDWDEGTWEQLTDPQKSVWRAYAERLRQEWSSTQHEPIPYSVLAQYWGQLNDEHTRVMTLLREKEWRQVPAADWEPAEPTQPAQNDLSAVLAERLRATRQQAEGPVQATDHHDPRWLAMVAAGKVGGEEGQDAVIDAYSLGLERGVERGERKAQNAVCDVHGHTDGAEGPEDAARRFAGEIDRLAAGLKVEGIELRPGPVHGAPVDTALVALQNYWSPKLGLATTKTLLEELYARGNRNGWLGAHRENVRALLDELGEDELTYKTASGRAAKDD